MTLYKFDSVIIGLSCSSAATLCLCNNNRFHTSLIRDVISCLSSNAYSRHGYSNVYSSVANFFAIRNINSLMKIIRETSVRNLICDGNFNKVRPWLVRHFHVLQIPTFGPTLSIVRRCQILLFTRHCQIRHYQRLTPHFAALENRLLCSMVKPPVDDYFATILS